MPRSPMKAQTQAHISRTPENIVILSGSGTSRSEVHAESKDPYYLLIVLAV